MILITGLDGSGKSTLLDKLENTIGSKVHIIRVPSIDIDKFQENNELWKASKFVNHLGMLADKEQDPSLKIIAMFGAMVLFPKLCEHLISFEKKEIICERHPFIDTAVYGSAYLKLMHPKYLNPKITQPLEQAYSAELEFIIGTIRPEISRSNSGQFYDLMNFVSHLFSEKSLSPEDRFRDVFKIEKPDHVYFLDAPTNVLLERIGQRDVREHHESEKALAMMKPLYVKVFNSMGLNYSIIDTVGWRQVDDLEEKLIKRYR